MWIPAPKEVYARYRVSETTESGEALHDEGLRVKSDGTLPVTNVLKYNLII